MVSQVQGDGIGIHKCLNGASPRCNVIDVHVGIDPAQIHLDLINATDIFIPQHQIEDPAALLNEKVVNRDRLIINGIIPRSPATQQESCRPKLQLDCEYRLQPASASSSN